MAARVRHPTLRTEYAGALQNKSVESTRYRNLGVERQERFSALRQRARNDARFLQPLAQLVDCLRVRHPSLAPHPQAFSNRSLFRIETLHVSRVASGTDMCRILSHGNRHHDTASLSKPDAVPMHAQIARRGELHVDGRFGQHTCARYAEFREAIVVDIEAVQ